MSYLPSPAGANAFRHVSFGRKVLSCLLSPAILIALLLALCIASAAQAQTKPDTPPPITTPIPSPDAIPPPPDDPDPGPIDDSAVIDFSAPASMTTGSTAWVTVTMQNTGNTTWSGSIAGPYRLGIFNPLDSPIWGVGRSDIGGTVTPNSLVSFGFAITAPTTPGTYSFDWRMLREGQFWFGAIATRTITVTAPAPPPAPVNGAAVIGVSAPSQMTTGQAYTVAVTMKNTGTSTWSPGAYLLGSQNPQDNLIWGAKRVHLGSPVAPGQQHQFTVQVTAPAPGSYAMQWRMVQEDVEWFGGTSSTPITVVNAAPPPPPPPPAPTISVWRSPATMTAGQSYTLSWSTSNATSLSRVCTAGGTGFASDAWMALNSSETGTASAAWVNYPSTCTWTATGTGTTTRHTETMTTVAAASGGVTYIHTDGLGSPVARTNASGALISRTRYEPYGHVAAGATPTIGFTGHVNDSDTGLTYMQQRYYDPVAGRFLSVDPVVTDAANGNSFNRYAYAENNPYRYKDPDGRAVESITMDKNRNVHIVLGLTYVGRNVTQAQAAAWNASIIQKWSGRFGAYNVRVTIIPGSQAKFGNVVTIKEGSGLATATNGAREVTMFTSSPRGTFVQVLHHEMMHVMGTKHAAGDRYDSQGKAQPGWEGNISADAAGEVDERNIEDIVTRERPYLPASARVGTGPDAQSTGGPQGCMAKGGNCWN